MQCKYVHEFLSGLIERGIRPGKQTAIVLTDESLLLPVLYSIPEQIEQVNVTMGYPLRQTMAYSFVERLVELQSRRKPGRDGKMCPFRHTVPVEIDHHFYTWIIF